LSDATPEERLKALLETPVQDLVAKIPPSALTAPAVDGDIVPSDVSFEEVGKQDSNVPRGKSWCQDLMIGDAELDVSLTADVKVSTINDAPRLLFLHSWCPI
jgi:hypothetical protein